MTDMNYDKHRIHKFNLTVHALHGQRQIINIRVDRAGKHTVLTFLPGPKISKLRMELQPSRPL